MNWQNRIYESLLNEGKTTGDDVKATVRRVGRAYRNRGGSVGQAVDILGRLEKRHGEQGGKTRKDFMASVSDTTPEITHTRASKRTRGLGSNQKKRTST